MILDNLSRSQRYVSLQPLFAEAFSFLNQTNLSTVAVGRHSIVGDKCYVSVSNEVQGKGIPPMEYHRRYLDIHYFVVGEAQMAWKAASDCVRPQGDFSTERDVQLFDDEPDFTFSLKSGLFVILYPEDAHRSIVTTPQARKVVVKIEVQ